MCKTGLVRGWWFVLGAGLAAWATGTTAHAAARKAPAPSETPIPVVADAAAARAALDQARAAGQALIADLTLGHEGQLVRAKAAAPLSPGRYRLHALVACTAKDQALGEGVALRLVAGGSQGLCAPGAWGAAKEGLATVQLDFMVDLPGQSPVAADWLDRGDRGKRQAALDQLSLQSKPGPGLSPAATDDAGLGGGALEDLMATEGPPLAPRALAAAGLPPYRLMLAGLVLERLSPVLKVRLDGRECAIRYTPLAVIAGFDLAQAATVEVECKGPVQRVDVRPKHLGIRPEVTGNKITIALAAPACLSVELDGNTSEPLHLFADPPDQDAPKPGTPGVKFFAAGKVHEPGIVPVQSGETVYLERGAVVRGAFLLDNVKNVKILGRGMLDGGWLRPAQTRAIEIARAADVVVEGITILDSKHWAIPVLRSDRVTVRRVKIVSGNHWDDGVVVVGSQDVTVEKCFIRTKDSCVAIKAGLTYFTQLDCQREVANVVVRDCVLWSGECGSGLDIRTQNWLPDWVGRKPDFVPRAASIHGIRFANSDLLHGAGPGAAFTIHHSDEATVSAVTCEDLRVEDWAGALIDCRILPSPYAPNAERGRLRDIVFRDLRVEGATTLPSVLLGFDEQHRIEGVVFENVQAGGRKWTRREDGPLTTEFATGVEFR